MKLDLNEVLQWVGAVFIIGLHALNAVGPRAYPYNIVCATLGTICFLTWSYRVANKPQLVVNVVAMSTCALGLFRAWA